MLQGEKEAEKMIVEAYAALLLAFLSTERFSFLLSFASIVRFLTAYSEIITFFFFAIHSKRIRDTIADYLPDRNLSVLVPVLERFVVCTCFDLVIQNTCEAYGRKNI